MAQFSKTNSAGFMANHMARLFAIALQRRIKPLGLAPAQFMVLVELWQGDGLTQRELVERLDVEQATMANTLQRMERDGLIERKPDPQDQRARRIMLTGKARALQEPAIAAALETNADALGELSEYEADQLINLMEKVISSLRSTNP